MRTLRSEVADLKKAVDSQTNEIMRLHEKLNKLQPGGAEGARRSPTAKSFCL
jgi:hypothetical protein